MVRWGRKVTGTPGVGRRGRLQPARRVALALSLALVLDAAVLSSRVQTTDSIENWVSDTLRTMTLDQKIGQLINVGIGYAMIQLNLPNFDHVHVEGTIEFILRGMK